MPKGKVIATPIDENENVVCNYGCGKKAKFRFTNGKVCCSTIHTKCDANKKHLSEKNSGKANTGILFENNDNLICDFGCGQVAKYKFKNKKVCCEKYVNTCPSVTKKMSNSMTGKEVKGVKIDNTEGIICEFGCGQLANYKFKLGRYCCTEKWERCPAAKEKNCEMVKNKWVEPEFRNKVIKSIRESRDDEFCNNVSIKKFMEWQDPKSLHNSIERNKKLSKSQKMGLEKLTKKFPDFVKDRNGEVREDEETRKIIVKCDCCEQWFIPEREYLYEATFRSTIKYEKFLMLCTYECFNKMGIKPKKWSYTVEYEKFKEYSNMVIKETEKTIRKHGDKIKGLYLRGKKFGYEVDHKLSIIQGFKLNVDIKIMSHWKNLEILTRIQNRKKLGNSSITLEELLTEIKNIQ